MKKKSYIINIIKEKTSISIKVYLKPKKLEKIYQTFLSC